MTNNKPQGFFVPATHGSGARALSLTKLEVEISLASESHFFAGITGDILRGGLFLATYRKLPVGLAVDLEISLPDGPMIARGRVCFSREAAEGMTGGVGIRFVDLAQADRSRIERFCNFRSPLYFDIDE